MCDERAPLIRRLCRPTTTTHQGTSCALHAHHRPFDIGKNSLQQRGIMIVTMMTFISSCRLAIDASTSLGRRCGTQLSQWPKNTEHISTSILSSYIFIVKCAINIATIRKIGLMGSLITHCG